jgi:hypothetical protein
VAHSKALFPNSFCTSCTPEEKLRYSNSSLFGGAQAQGTPLHSGTDRTATDFAATGASRKPSPQASNGSVRTFNQPKRLLMLVGAPASTRCFLAFNKDSLRLGGSGRRSDDPMRKAAPARRRKSAGTAQEKANPKSTLEKASFWKKKEGFSESPN